jgi:DNA-binding response OmpR family regulator
MAGDRKRDCSRGRGSVLVFDEERVILDLLALVLSRQGYRVTTTARYEEALELCSQGTFDLAIADLGLHNGHGRHLVQEMNKVNPRTVVVSMAAYPTEEIQAFAKQHTAAFLVKPFEMAELLATARGALSRESAEGSALGGTLVSSPSLRVAAVN